MCGKASVLCEINREDQFQHQNEECRFREVKCHNCKEMSSMVQEIGTSFGGLSEHVQSSNKQSTEVKTGLTALENKFENMENKFENMENKFGDRFKQMENRFEKVENQLLRIQDLGQHGGERDENKNSRSDQACAAESSSGMEGIKQPNQYAYVVAGGYGKDGKPLRSAEVFDKTSNS